MASSQYILYPSHIIHYPIIDQVYAEEPIAACNTLIYIGNYHHQSGKRRFIDEKLRIDDRELLTIKCINIIQFFDFYFFYKRILETSQYLGRLNFFLRFLMLFWLLAFYNSWHSYFAHVLSYFYSQPEAAIRTSGHTISDLLILLIKYIAEAAIRLGLNFRKFISYKASSSEYWARLKFLGQKLMSLLKGYRKWNEVLKIRLKSSAFKISASIFNSSSLVKILADILINSLASGTLQVS